MSWLLAALGFRRRRAEGEREQVKSVRSASPPAATSERAGIAEASPAGERSGRDAVPGPAQDGETSTVDQSREWPDRDTAPRQDPAESRLNPIWGSDPPDAVRWHMGMTPTDQGHPATGPTSDQSSSDAEAQPRSHKASAVPHVRSVTDEGTAVPTPDSDTPQLAQHQPGEDERDAQVMARLGEEARGLLLPTAIFARWSK